VQREFDPENLSAMSGSRWGAHMTTVFISYRRETASGEARALFNDLVDQLGKNSVFMDVDSIALGRDFRSILQKTLGTCDLMLVIIDKDWVTVKDEKGKIRLENPSDYVRLEVEAALKRDIVVTPVLVKGRRCHPLSSYRQKLAI
jgi:hypothetical protein